MKKLLLGFSVVLCLLYVTGCGDANDRKTTQNQYADDGNMGISSSNPGLLTSPGARNYTNDTHVVEMALKDVPSIRRISVLYRGSEAIVRIWGDRNLSDADLAAIRSEAEDRLAVALPRYQIRVRMYR